MNVEALSKGLPPSLDLTNPEDAARARTLSLILTTIEDLDALEAEAIAQAAPLTLHLAIKLARARRILEQIEQPTHITVCFAMYKEHTRIVTQAEHPNGEDFLRRKLAQMAWHFEGLPQFTWDLVAVDDGCPEGSGTKAQEIIDKLDAGDYARVLYLQDAIDQGLAVAAGLGSTRDSQKGGAILYGMYEATQRIEAPRHVVAYTDADLSTHLGQVGLLLGGLEGGKLAAAASRRDPRSVVIKQGARNDRGKLFIYLWKRLLPTLGHLVDTQCGFKAFDAKFLAEIVEGIAEKRFAFDIELLLNTELRQAQGAVTVPLCWIDSEAASTTTDLQPYLPMLKSIADMYRRLLPADDAADQFAALIEGLDEAAWARLLERIPTEITERAPRSFGDWAGVSAETLRAASEG